MSGNSQRLSAEALAKAGGLRQLLFRQRLGEIDSV